MEYVNQLQQEILSNLSYYLEYIEENNLTNRQEVLNFLDNLNKISVTYELRYLLLYSVMVTLRPLDPAFPVRVEGGATTFPCSVVVSTLLSKSGSSGSKPDRDTNCNYYGTRNI